MKIVVFQNCNPGLIGGAENSFHVFCSNLSKTGNDVYAIFPSRGKFDFVETQYKKVQFREKFRIKNYSLSVFSICRVIRSINPDVIHLADGLSPTDFLILVINKLFLKKPLFVDVWALYHNPIINILVKIQMPIYNLATKVGFSNPRVKKTAVRWFLSKKKIINEYWLEYTNVELKFNSISLPCYHIKAH